MSVIPQTPRAVGGLGPRGSALDPSPTYVPLTTNPGSAPVFPLLLKVKDQSIPYLLFGQIFCSSLSHHVFDSKLTKTGTTGYKFSFQKHSIHRLPPPPPSVFARLQKWPGS